MTPSAPAPSVPTSSVPTPSGQTPSGQTPTGSTSSGSTPALPLARLLNHTADAVQAVRAGESLTAALARCPAPARPGTQALAFHVLRLLGSAEAARARLAPKAPSPAVDALLLSALALIWPAADAPYAEHTLVDQAVAAMRRRAPQSAAFTNAVLRRFLREREAIVAAATADPVVRYNHPRWWIERLQRDWPDEWQAILDADNLHPPMTLRVNVRRGNSADYVERLSRHGIAAQALGGQALGGQGLGGQGLGGQGLGTQGLGTQGLGTQGLGTQGLGGYGLSGHGHSEQPMSGHGVGGQGLGNWPSGHAHSEQPMSGDGLSGQALNEQTLKRHAREGQPFEGRPLASQAVLLDKPCPVQELPGFAEGDVSVQDAAAQIPAPLLAAALRPGARVLDACAAPGGKTAHLLELGDFDVLALDRDAVRLGRVDDTLARLGLKAETRAADAADPATWWDGRPFDAILLDAPCSASGIVRRHPDARWLRRAADIDALARTQARLLDALWPLLAPGGRLLYCTCSVFKAEGREQIDAFLQREPAAILAASPPSPGHLLALADNRAMAPAPGFSTAPDGFFYALIEKLRT